MSTLVKAPAHLDSSAEIAVNVVSAFIPDESDLSDPSDRRYVFAYHIEIENQGARTVKLMSRHWWITDENGQVREVEGEGVIGKQPVLAPGQVFSYSSWCVLPTASGRMRGTYSMAASSGETIEVPIPQFNLIASSALN
jgi:ApaG protein